MFREVRQPLCGKATANEKEICPNALFRVKDCPLKESELHFCKTRNAFFIAFVRETGTRTRDLQLATADALTN